MKTRPALILIRLLFAAMLAQFGITSAVGQVWTATGNMNTARYRHTITLLPSGKVLVAGGSLSGHVCEECLHSAELYDPATGLWTPTGSMNFGRDWHTATLLNSGKVLVAAGNGFASGFEYSAELYGPASPTPTPGPCVDPPSGMVAWWPGDGNADDIQGSNNGSLQNGATFVAGKVLQAFSLDGVDDFVAVPHNDSLNPTGPFSVDLWVNASPQQSESLALIIDKSHGWTDGSGWGIQSSASSTCFFYGTGANTGDFHGACTLTGIFDGQWHHLAGVWTGTEIQIYQDAVLKDTLAFSTPPVNNTRDVHIGMSSGGGSPNRFFHGMVDQVEYFNRALTAAEIEAIYNAGSAGKCKPTPTPTPTATATPIPTATGTATATATFTPTPTATATFTPTATATATFTPTPTPTAANTPTPPPTATATFTPTATATATFTPTPTPTATATFTPNHFFSGVHNPEPPPHQAG